MRACLLSAAVAGMLAAGGCSSDAGVVAKGDAAVLDAAPADAPPPPPPSEPGRHTIEVVDSRRVVPSPGLPADLPATGANNNLDVVRHTDGRVYLAWRNAPDHFASTSVVINVVSSTDETSWQREASFTQGTDLREPRFLSWDGTLFLYVSLLGSAGLSFEPRGVARAEKPAPGGAGFSTLDDLGWPPYIVWRTRVELGRPYMLRYLGGANLYAFEGEPLTVELLTSTDGRAWSPAAPGQPVVWTGGGSEADFAQTTDETLYGIIRNEGGDDDGWGSKICRTSGTTGTTVAPWACRHDPRRFDSPLMFAHDGEIYLVARRNVSADGNFDLGSSEPDRKMRVIGYHIDYLTKPKRCAIWRFVPGEDRVAFVIDLPSRGDTCFPGQIAGDSPDTRIIYDYSSDIDAPELTWNQGQNGPTYIYRHAVRFTPR